VSSTLLLSASGAGRAFLLMRRCLRRVIVGGIATQKKKMREIMPRFPLALAAALFLASAATLHAEGDQSPKTIKIGQTLPYSGPVSVVAPHGRFQSAYFKWLNEQGGINGRMIDFISLDDGYSPPKTVEQTRRLVEQDQVLFMFGSIGSPTNAAVEPYLNQRGVPQLFVTTGAARFSDPEHWPWTLGWLPTYRGEGEAYAKYILQNIKDPKIAILYQNDDLGKDFVFGFKQGLGNPELVVAEASFETTDPTVDAQIVALHGSGANVLFYAGTQKAGAQHFRKVYEIGWKPAHFAVSITSSISAVLKPAGVLDMAEGVISAEFTKDIGDPAWKDSPDVVAYLAWIREHLPGAEPADVSNINAYMEAKALVQVLQLCGDDLSRKNIMYQATHLTHLDVPLLLPGITLSTSPTDYTLVHGRQLVRLEHGTWVKLGEPIGE
jgi:branched-chain amino acid transport system substrate-binding protein